MDDNNHNLSLAVTMDGVKASTMLIDWLDQNYSKYLKDVKILDVGLMVMDFSIAYTLKIRSDAVISEWKKLHPDLEKNIYHVDFTMDQG